MSKNYAIIIQFVLPLTTFYRSGAQRSNIYKRDAFVTSWGSHNRAWQPRRHDRLSETSGTLWIHRGALTNQRCSLATGCGINVAIFGSFHMNTLGPEKMADTLQMIIFFNENVCIANKTSLKCVPVSPVDSKSGLGQVMAWHLTHWGRVTHICICKLAIIGWGNGLAPEPMLEYC